MGLPDVVYLVRDSPHDDELRYSLRSLVNLPHRLVWIAGHKPKWVRRVGHLPTSQTGGKFANQALNLSEACEHPDVSDPFVMFNDDFFVVRQIDEVPVLHRGLLSEVSRLNSGRGSWRDRLRATSNVLGRDALSYDALHVPMTFEKAKMSDVLETMPHMGLFRSIYGNRYEVGGTYSVNVKIASEDKDLDGPFVSTSPSAFASGPVGKRLRKMFPDPCMYER